MAGIRLSAVSFEQFLVLKKCEGRKKTDRKDELSLRQTGIGAASKGKRRFLGENATIEEDARHVFKNSSRFLPEIKAEWKYRIWFVFKRF